MIYMNTEYHIVVLILALISVQMVGIFGLGPIPYERADTRDKIKTTDMFIHFQLHFGIWNTDISNTTDISRYIYGLGHFC